MAFGQTTGYVLKNADGSLNISENAITQAQVSGLTSALAGKAPLVNGGIGYASGAGGTVAQAGNKGNAVTLNKLSGQITTVNSALAAGAEVSFTLNNTFIAATDVVYVTIQSGGTAGAYLVSVGATAAGSCSITLSNASAGSLSQSLVLNFIVLKAANN